MALDIVHVTHTENIVSIQRKIDHLGPMGIIVFAPGTYDFHGRTLHGKDGVNLLSTGATITGTGVAFDFSGKTGWSIQGWRPPNEHGDHGFIFQGNGIIADRSTHWKVLNNTFNDQVSNGLN